MKYKVGDIVTIANNDGDNQFPIGESVRVVDIGRNNDYRAEYLDGKDWWWIEDKNIEGYEELKKLTAKEFFLQHYLPTTSEEDRENWYQTNSWCEQVVEIIEQYKQQ